MRIQLISDVHADINKHEDTGCFHKTESDVLVVAGDINNGRIQKTFDLLVKMRKHHDKLIIWVLGNHDYYNTVKEEVQREYRRVAALLAGEGIILLDNDIRVIANEKEAVTFIGTTLWSDGSFNAPGVTGWGMADYHSIRSNEIPRHNDLADIPLIHPGITREWHVKSKIWLLDAIRSHSKEKMVVVTHFGVSGRSIHPKYADDGQNGFFTSPLLEKNQICDLVPLFLHGHTHESLDYVAGKSRVVTNPRGYHNENPHFDPTLVIEV